MLGHAKLQSIICTTNLESAEAFYRDVLELTLKGRSDGALVFDVDGGDLRVSPVPTSDPGEPGFVIPMATCCPWCNTEAQ